MKTIKAFGFYAAFSTIEALEVLAETYPLKLSIEAKGDTANISIVGAIYNFHNNSQWFRSEVEKVKKDGARNVHLYLNTPGGDVFEANEIGNIIESFDGEVTGEGGALVASAGTYIASKCKTFEMPSNGKYMYHKPFGRIEGNEDEVASKLELLKSLTSDYRKNYADKTIHSETQIEKNWVKGDVWLSAEQAKKEGFITSVKKKVTLSAEDATLIAACGAPNIPKIKNTKTEIKRMELSVLAVELGLPATATEAQVTAKLKQVTADAAKVQGLVQAKADQEKAEKAAKVKALLDGAEKDKKITAEQRPQWEVIANGNLEAATTAIGALKSITAISGELNPGATAAATAEQANWTYADYLEKNPAAFDKLPEAKQTALVDAYYQEN
ncbi:ATP-dependent Clp protease proteolytic subunit [Polaribacter sp. MSW13]|uniref:ATP-dependent Clp protease proteolytic subunit n=1 Tax=Polaribacter marinus TaxID=2916838 RepID=A0A9X1VNR6_9FLAO|nr:Clp protease ClpP [Polaribacter marinus]MCI2229577.1 ATP-dependent Clp protease proteolytic subunit [Polaribacter marinus]